MSNSAVTVFRSNKIIPPCVQASEIKRLIPSIVKISIDDKTGLTVIYFNDGSLHYQQSEKGKPVNINMRSILEKKLGLE